MTGGTLRRLPLQQLSDTLWGYHPDVVDAIGEAVIGLRERKKRRTRATLIDAAIELCNRQGFEHTTVDQIAAVADVSPRTFSRYFATKDAVVLAFIDDVLEMVALELTRQPADIGHVEALLRANIQVFIATKSAAPNQLTADRLVASARIISSSAALMHAAAEYPGQAATAALADRMGVPADDPRVRLVGAVWGAIVRTALGGLGSSTDWDGITIDEIVGRVEAAYSQFAELTANVTQPA
jgi:AcrR family transcriptional regulator